MDRKEKIETPVGTFVAEFSAKGLRRLILPDFPSAFFPFNAGEYGQGLKGLLVEYLSGKKVDFSLIPVDLSDLPPFSEQVLLLLREIPYGHRVTYSQLATMVGSPKACRAVGQVLKRNPVPIVIPCHRVVAKGGLGGFSSGLEWKRWLLNLESGELRP